MNTVMDKIVFILNILFLLSKVFMATERSIHENRSIVSLELSITDACP